MAELLSDLRWRPLHLAYDFLSPQPTHLLDISLANFLPASPTSLLSEVSRARSSFPSRLAQFQLSQNARALPPAHHLVYFPPAIPTNQLLSDGTDSLHSPGPPFVRRMWAGGQVRINEDDKFRLKLTGGRAVCIEGIRNVQVKGASMDEKIYVNIERRIIELEPREFLESMDEGELIKKYWPKHEEEVGYSGVVEERNLVFMREISPEVAADAAKIQAKVLKPLHLPTFTHTLIPTASLLFRFSALTFNAHAIHLDKEYCRSTEGHRNLLVHGPLSLVLLVSLLRHHLATNYSNGSMHMKDISYRNLAPLYAEEEMKLCGREVTEDKYELWAETPAGGYAVRATAYVGHE